MWRFRPPATCPGSDRFTNGFHLKMEFERLEPISRRLAQVVFSLDLLDVATLDDLGQDTLIQKFLDVELGDLGIAQRNDLLDGFQNLHSHKSIGRQIFEQKFVAQLGELPVRLEIFLQDRYAALFLRAHDRAGLDERLDEVLHGLRAFLNEPLGTHERARRQSDLAEIEQNFDAEGLKPGGLQTIQRRAVDEAARQGLGDDCAVADRLNIDMVLLRVHAHLSQRQHAEAPEQTAEILHTDFLAAQIAGLGDRRRHEKIVGRPLGEERENDFEVGPLRGGREHTGGAASNELHLVGDQSRDLNWSAAHGDEVRLQSVPGKNPVVLGEPNRRARRRHTGVSDANLLGADGRNHLGQRQNDPELSRDHDDCPPPPGDCENRRWIYIASSSYYKARL